MITVAAAARTDAGMVRAVNEDSVLARSPAFLVADGMGGHAGGAAASQAALRVLGRQLAPGVIPSPDDVLDAVRAANTEVRGLSAVGDSGAAVAGTTLTGVVQVQQRDEPRRAQWLVLNVGDSRVYGWDGEALQQLTLDHSAVQELLDAGIITAGEALVHPERNIITRALGADDDVEADGWLLAAAGRQTFLVCSDGLTKELDDAALASIVAEHDAEYAHAEYAQHDTDDAQRDAETRAAWAASLADALVDAALAAGGRDNVSVIVVRSETSAEAGQW